MKNKKLTMKDIATMAGVGKTTVSRYFNGGYVKEETKQKIKAIIDEYHYQPNTFAQSLKAKQSKIIGVIAPSLTSTASSRMLTSLDEYLKNEGYTSLIMNTHHNQLQELAAIEKFWQMNVDGIVLLATELTMAHHTIASKIDIPIVFVAQKMEGGISIINDDYRAGYQVGKYASQMNHQDIVYLGVKGYDEAVGHVRKAGVFEGLKDHGIDHVKTLETDFTFETTRKVVKEYIQNHLPSLFICATDNIALATFKELKEANIRVPQEVSLIGFGGYEVSELITPSLTTVRFYNEQAGQEAGKTIIKWIQGEEIDDVSMIGFDFIEGGSVIKK